MRRRRWAALLMTLMLVLSMMPSALATTDTAGSAVPEHTHQWTSLDSDMVEWQNGGPTCTEGDHYWVWCTICEQYGVWTSKEGDAPPLGHDWGDLMVDVSNTCTEPGTGHRVCRRCQATSAPESFPAHGHVWPDWTVTKEPTCTAEGSKTRTCRYQDATETEAIPALGHAWGDWVTTKQPTCTAEGTQTSTCSRCGATQTRSVAALGHSQSGWTTVKEPTCTGEGRRESSCTRCGEKYAEAIPALGHAYGGWTTTREPTCAQEGQKQTKCSRCGDTVYDSIPKTAHTWGAWYTVKEPTKWESGIDERKCQVCGATEQRDTYMEGTVMPGEHSDNAKHLQELLNEAGFDCGKADGIVGPNTQKAIKEAEEAAGHPATGIGWVGLQEWLEQGGTNTGTPASGGPAVSVTFHEYDGFPPVLNETIKTLVEIKNVGTDPLRMVGYDLEDGSGNDKGLDEGYTEWSYSEENVDQQNFQPGQRYFIDYYITVTGDDVSVGELKRKFAAFGVSLTDGTMCQDDDSMTLSIGEGQVGAELTLTGKTQEYTDFYPEDIFVTGLRVDNTGAETVYGLTINLWKWDFAKDDWTEIGPVYQDLADAPTAPGGYGAQDDQYHITYDDADWGLVTLLYVAEATTADGDLVTSNPFECEFEVKKREGAAPVLYLEALDYSSLVGHLGETLRVPLLLSNTGTDTVNWCYHSVVDGEDNYKGPESDVYSDPAYPDEIGWLKPGKSQHLILEFAVTKDDIDAGAVIRKTRVGGFRPLSVQPSGTEYELDDDGTYKDYDSNWVTIRIPVESDDSDIDLYIEQTGPASQPDGALGETIEIPIKATNVGSVPLHDYYWVSRDGDDNDRPLDNESVTSGSGFKLYHDDSFTTIYSIEVTQADVDAGVIRRIFWHKAHPWVVSEAAEYEDCDTDIASNKLEFEFPLRQVPPEGDGALKVEAGTPSQPDGALGEWIDVPLKVTNDGGVAIWANNHVMWSPETGDDLNGPYIENLWTGTGVPWPLQPGLYFDDMLHIHVTQEDVDAGEIRRTVYYYGKRDDADVNVFSNTETITLPLRGTPDDGSYVDLELAVDGPVAVVYPQVDDVVDVPLILTNKGTAAARMSGWTSWYQDDSAAYYLDNIDIDWPTWYWLVPGGENHQTYHAKVTEDDVKAGVIIRYVQQAGHRWLVSGGLSDPSAESAENAAVLDFNFYNTNVVKIEIPLLQDPPVVVEPGEPKLVLSMVQQSPVKTAYADGEVITYNWTLTNIGDADCDFGGLKVRFTSTDGSLTVAEDAFVGLDGRLVLAAHGGHTEGTDSLKLDAAKIADSGTIRAVFYGRGYYPHTTDVWVLSNEKAFTYPIDNSIWTPDPDTTYKNLLVEKWEEPPRPRPQGYAQGEYVLYGVCMTNKGDVTLTNIVVEDPLYVNDENTHVLGTIASLKPGNNYTYFYVYTVQPEDVSRTYIENTATATWPDPGLGDPVTSNSNPVTVPTCDFPPVPVTNAISVTKVEKTGPKNGKFYQQGEEIGYNIFVVNNTDQPIHDIKVTDTLATGDKVIATIAELAPHTAHDVGFGYYVTAMDCGLKSVTNTAGASGTDVGGNKVSAVSDPVTSKTGFETPDPTTGKKDPDGEYPFGVLTGLSLTKTETSHPANGSYYTEGETITYKITAVNTGETVLTDVTVYDALAGFSEAELGSAELLHPDEARSFSFSHTVTAADVTRGYVLNTATAVFTMGSYFDSVNSNDVLSDTDGNPDDITNLKESFSKVTLPGEGEGYVPCTLTLNAKGDGVAEYTQHTCAVHLSVQRQIEALLAGAATDEARVTTWKLARALWQGEIDKLYNALYEAADGPRGKAAILNERVMFYAQAEVFEAALMLVSGDELPVAEKIAGVMQNKCAQLCYEVHTAPEHRVDSWLNDVTALTASDAAQCGCAVLERQEADVRYLEALCPEHAATDAAVLDLLERAADDEALKEAWEKAQGMWVAALDADANIRYRAVKGDDRKVVASDRMTFNNWLAQRRALLDLLYPDSAEACEVAARTVMIRTVDYCIAESEAGN